MYSDDDLDAAVSAGIFSEQATQDFRALVAARQHTTLLDEEHFRLLSGFNDIFVVIACVLLLGSVAWLGSSAAPVLGALGVAVLSWPLAEFFVRRRRMALPAIVLLASFVSACSFSVLLPMEQPLPEMVLLAGGGSAALAAWLHWRRFQVPITVAAGAGALIMMLTGLLTTAVPVLEANPEPLFLLGGLAAFVLAMVWDRQDPQRQKRQSDVAFWLHLLAAPLIVHPFFAMLGILEGESGALALLLVVGLYLLFGVVSLAVDRRALLVSALAYVLYAFSQLLETVGVDGAGFALAGLLIGSALLMLSAFWHRCRTVLLAYFPAGVLSGLPPLK